MDPPGTQPTPTNGAQQAGGRPTNKRLQQTQAQVDEVVGIMKVFLKSFLVGFNLFFRLMLRRFSSVTKSFHSWTIELMLFRFLLIVFIFKFLFFRKALRNSRSLPQL